MRADASNVTVMHGETVPRIAGTRTIKTAWLLRGFARCRREVRSRARASERSRVLRSETRCRIVLRDLARRRIRERSEHSDDERVDAMWDTTILGRVPRATSFSFARLGEIWNAERVR